MQRAKLALTAAAGTAALAVLIVAAWRRGVEQGTQALAQGITGAIERSSHWLTVGDVVAAQPFIRALDLALRERARGIRD